MMSERRDSAPILSLRGIGKSYGAVVAVRDVDLDLHAGEVLAMCGDNGAGKSSLIKVISGAEEPTSGTIALRGESVRFQSPHDALARGVATIYQDLALAPRLSIAANVFLGAELTRTLGLPFLRVLDKRTMARDAKGYLARLCDRDRRHDEAGGIVVGRATPGGRDLARAALERRHRHHGRADRRARRRARRRRCSISCAS